MVVVGDKEGGLGASHIYYRRPSHRPVVFRGTNRWEGGQIFPLIFIGVFLQDNCRSGQIAGYFVKIKMPYNKLDISRTGPC